MTTCHSGKAAQWRSGNEGISRPAAAVARAVQKNHDSWLSRHLPALCHLATLPLCHFMPRPSRSTLLIATFAICYLPFAISCAAPRGPIFDPLDQPLVWPAPPDPPRIHYLGAIATEQDLKPGRSLGQALGQTIFGKRSVRSMLTPYAITAEGDRLFICDSNAQCIHIFDLETRRYHQWRPSREHEPFAQPVGIAWDGTRLLVADPVVGALFAFDQRGTSLGWLGRDHLERPVGLAVDSARDRIFVADTGLHQIRILTARGDLNATLGERGSGPAQFNFPTNIAVDPAGRIYITDSLNARIQVFEPDLSYAGQIGSRGNRPGHFSQPKGIAASRHGHIYIVDSHFEAVQIFDQFGQLLLSFGEEGRGPAQFWLPAGIYIGSDDRIWIADSYNRRVQVFEYREPAGEGETVK
jgi:sugar lactone lactonase YvrE